MDLLDLITGVSIDSKGIYQFNDEYNMKIYAKQGDNATLNSKVLIKRREDSKYDISYIQDSPTIPLSSRDDIQVTLIPDTEEDTIDIKTNPVLYARKSTVLFSSGSEIILNSYLGHTYLELRNSDIKSSSVINSILINNMKHIVRIDDEENASFSILDDKTDLELAVIEKTDGKLNIEVIGIVNESILNSSISVDIDGSLYKCNINSDLILDELGASPSSNIYSLEKVETKHGIFFNGKEVTPKLNGKDLSRVMYNGKKIWPATASGPTMQEAWVDAGFAELIGSNRVRFMLNDQSEFTLPVVSDSNKLTSLVSAFGMAQSSKITIDGVDFSGVTDMSNMFNTCNSSNILLTNIGASKVTNVSYMFANCPNLLSVSLKGIDFSNVTNKSGMFQGSQFLNTIYCDSATQDWLTQNETEIGLPAMISFMPI